MNQTIEKVLAAIELGPVQQFGELAVLPIVTAAKPLFAYVSLGEALGAGTLVIGEVSEGGSVPQLTVANSGGAPVLLVDGEELVGAKQNRVLNASTMVPAKSSLVLPVSCTEVGRWRHVSRVFADSGVVAAQSVRRKKSLSVQRGLEHGMLFRSDQGEVWDDIEKLQARSGTSSATGAMRDAFAAHERTLEECVASIPLLDGQVGMVALFGDKVVGLDLVSRPEVYAALH